MHYIVFVLTIIEEYVTKKFSLNYLFLITPFIVAFLCSWDKKIFTKEKLY